jgi:hypothetical protein
VMENVLLGGDVRVVFPWSDVGIKMPSDSLGTRGERRGVNHRHDSEHHYTKPPCWRPCWNGGSYHIRYYHGGRQLLLAVSIKDPRLHVDVSSAINRHVNSPRRWF